MKHVVFLIVVFLFGNAATFTQTIDSLRENNITKMREILVTKSDANLANEDKKSILMYAVWIGNLEIVKLLIEQGADVNAQDISGKTALMLAIYKQQNDIAIYLIENGADVNIVSSDEQTALSLVGAKDKNHLLEMMIP